MGTCCSKCFRDEDIVQFPVQCEDAEENQVAHAGDTGRIADDFIDLRLPLQCTEPSPPILPTLPRCAGLTDVCLDILLSEFYTHLLAVVRELSRI